MGYLYAFLAELCCASIFKHKTDDKCYGQLGCNITIDLDVTMNASTKFVVTAITTKLVVTGVTMKLVLTAVTTSNITAIMMKLDVLVYFSESRHLKGEQNSC